MNARSLHLDDAVLYYDFPTYADYETVVHKPDFLLLSRRYGVAAVRILRADERIHALDESLARIMHDVPDSASGRR